MSLDLRGVSGSILFALLWVVFTVLRPTSTFHLAPLIVAAWPSLGERDLQRAVPVAVAGGVTALLTTLFLSVAGLLQGPSLLPGEDRLSNRSSPR